MSPHDDGPPTGLVDAPDVPISIEEIAWGRPVESSRDQSLEARLARAIEAGDDELEPASPHLAAVQAWIGAQKQARAEAKAKGLNEIPCGDLNEILEALAKLDDADYEPLRSELKRLSGWRAAVIDSERVKRRRQCRPESLAEGLGASAALADVEPWPDPVDGAALLGEIAKVFGRYIVLPEGGATAATLWTLFSHATAAFDISPLLAISSAEMRCGKSTLLTVLGRLVPRAIPASNVSAAALFRSVELWQPTLLVDEADSFLRDNEELRGVLNSGHHRANAYVVRCDGEANEPRRFCTWSAKILALIGRLPATLADRSVRIRMRRKAPAEEVERLRLDRFDVRELCRKAARWAADNGSELRVADPELPESLDDRAADNWRPLVAIADRAGGRWPERARKAAGLLAGNGDDNSASARIMLLGDLRELFAERGVDRLPSSEIVGALVEREERPWPEYRRGKPITVRQVASLLQGFEIRPRQLRVGASKFRGYRKSDLVETWKRYLPEGPPDPSGTPVQGPPDGAFPVPDRPDGSGTVPDHVPDEKTRNRLPRKGCTGVPDGFPSYPARNSGQGEVVPCSAETELDL